MRGLTCLSLVLLVAYCACADLPDCGPGAPLHSPHPTDCSKYYTCDNGEPVLQSCAPGLWWNTDIEGCDLPEHTTCDAATTDVTTPSTTAGTEPTTTVGTEPTTTAGTTISSTTVNTGSTSAPPTTTGPMCGPGSPTHIPHPTDCSKYYTCDEGVAILQNCPPGLWWNVAVESCDFPENTICAASSSTQGPTTDGPTTTEGPTTTQGSTTDGPPTETTPGGGSSTTDPHLPDCHGETDTLLPHPTDCTKFYKCLNGVPFIQNCPPGLWWHQEILGCDYPDLSGCTPGSTSATSATTGPPIETTTA